jgi:hypothetical protein
METRIRTPHWRIVDIDDKKKYAGHVLEFSVFVTWVSLPFLMEFCSFNDSLCFFLVFFFRTIPLA